tara:strand:- start:52 stop:324 length:273 start_codon:yes stop_codon:yes gene_type:complete
MKVTVSVKIFGIVQGVFYRKSTYDKAIELGVVGWVKNCDDGTVEALFQGTQVQVDTILDWCHEGPERAIVSGIEVNIINSIKDFDSFSII